MCEQCSSKRGGFSHRGFDFCIDCMSALISWYLDGGIVEEPEQFAYVIDADFDPPEVVEMVAPR